MTGMAGKHAPLSPHLQIYRLPVAALLSVTHRATGLLLTLGTPVLVYWLVAVARGPEAYDGLHDILGSWYGLIGLFLWSFALFFHLCNGIRHLFWDAGYGFEMKTVDASGQVVLVATAILTVITWLAAFVSQGILT
jgi:succinate dehydrogenase / fumarate reductase cytochrome b subunit